jgi:hypothetical protein
VLWRFLARTLRAAIEKLLLLRLVAVVDGDSGGVGSAVGSWDPAVTPLVVVLVLPGSR